MKLYKGLQTVVKDTWKGGDIGNFQVNTYNGDSWIINGNIKKKDINDVKAMQLQKINSNNTKIDPVAIYANKYFQLCEKMAPCKALEIIKQERRQKGLHCVALESIFSYFKT